MAHFEFFMNRITFTFVKTYLSEIDMDVIRTAINQELDRGGQIFYVLPKITDIGTPLPNAFPKIAMSGIMSYLR